MSHIWLPPPTSSHTWFTIDKYHKNPCVCPSGRSDDRKDVWMVLYNQLAVELTLTALIEQPGSGRVYWTG